MSMTPQQKIKHMALAIDAGWSKKELPEVTSENVDDLYEEMVEADAHWDAIAEVREGDIETTIPCESSRHYESKSVAKQAPDGSWVGWTYWYGGGKYGEPESVDWVSYAYDLDCQEEEQMVVVRTFTRKDAA